MEHEKERGWGAAVEAAFLAALETQGTVKAACAAIGKWPTNAYQHRKAAPEFAGRWDAIVDARRVARVSRMAAPAGRARAGKGLGGYRVRHDGWTEGRRKAFLVALSETGCVKDACKRARISSNSAYRLRKLAPEFAKAWDRAIAKAAPTIEAAAFTRAVEGWDEIVERDGEVVSRKRRYSDSLLRLLLQRGDMRGDRKGMSQAELREYACETAAMAGGSFHHPDEDEAARARLEAKLAEMHERLMADAADAPRCPACGQAQRG